MRSFVDLLLAQVPREEYERLVREAERTGDADADHLRANLDGALQVYDTLEEQIGFETTRGDASRPWLVLGVVFATAGLTIALVRRQRLP